MRAKITLTVLLVALCAFGYWLLFAQGELLRAALVIGVISAGVAVGYTAYRRIELQPPMNSFPIEWLDDLPQPVFITDPNGNFIFVNRAYEKHSGFSRAEVLGKHTRNTQPSEQSLRFLQQDENVKKSPGVVQSLEITIENARKEFIDIVVSKVLVQNVAGMSSILATVTDISELRQAETALADERERLSLVIKASQQGVFDLCVNGETMHYLSAQALKMLGLVTTPDQPYSSVFQNLIDVDRKQFEHEMQLFFSSNQETLVTEFQVAKHEGARQWIRLQGTVVKSDSRTTRFVGSVVDVTAIKQSELQLIAQKKLITDVLEMSPSAIFLKDAEGVWRMVNQAWEKIAAQDRSNVIGYRSRDFQRSDVADQNEAQDRELLASTDGFLQRRIIFHNRLGAFYDAVITKRVIREPDGKIWGIIGTVLDLTERFKLERQVANQRELLDTVIRSSQVGIWDRDLMSGTTFTSERYNAILGFNPGEDLNDVEFSSLVHPDDTSEVTQRLDKVYSGAEHSFASEFRIRRVSGDYIWIDARGVGLFDDDGHLKRFVGSINDISERKARERELEIANKDALQAAAAKASFLSTMSHEIRTPLNGVIGAASLLESTNLDPEQKRFVDTIHSSGEALLSVVSDVLDFSKIDSDRMLLDLAPVVLVDLLEQVIDILAEKARSKRIEIFYELDPTLPAIAELDPVRIRQILLNLLGNAIKFTHRGYVSLRVSRYSELAATHAEGGSKDTLLFAVTDTGIGISKEHFESIFEPFAQADSSTTRRFGGTGLGLAIVRKLCAVMGGSINVVSEPDKGSTFTAAIPLKIPSMSAKPATGVQRLAFENSSTPNTIALCVPHAGLAQSLNRMLMAWGLAVETFETADALSTAAAAGKNWSAIVIDLDQSPDRVLNCFNRVPLAFVIGISQTTSTQLQGIYSGVNRKLGAQLLKPVRQSQLYNSLLQTIHAVETPANNLPGSGDEPRTSGNTTQLLYTLNVSSHPDVTAMQSDHDTKSSLHNLPVLIAEDNIVNQIIIREMARRAHLKPMVVSDGKAALKHAMSGQYPVVILDINMPELSGLDVARELVAQLPKHQRPYMIALTAHALTGDRETCLAAGMDDYLSKPLQAKSLQEALVRLEPALQSRHAWRRFLQPYADGLIGEVLDVAQLEEISGTTTPDSNAISTREFVTTLISNFERRGNEIITQLDVLVPAYEVHKAQQLAHTLVGSALNIGAKAFGEHMRQLEHALRQRESGQASKLVISVRPLFDQALGALRHWLNVYYAQPPKNVQEKIISPKTDS